MSRKRELLRRLNALTEIADIMSAMKSLALMETRILHGFLESQSRMVSGIEAAAADFLAWSPEYTPAASESREVCVLVGSEQGFCGDFNDALVQWLRTAENAPAHWAVLGQRLSARLGDDPRTLLSLSGATISDEVPLVLLRLTGEIDALLEAKEMANCSLSVLYHCDATNSIRLRRLLPLRDLPAPRAQAYPPELNLAPERFFTGLTEHYLYAALNDVLYSSLMAENRQRLAHMDRALQRLDEESSRLTLKYNAQRQEEIIEEIEVILLSAELLAGATR